MVTKYIFLAWLNFQSEKKKQQNQNWISTEYPLYTLKAEG